MQRCRGVIAEIRIWSTALIRFVILLDAVGDCGLLLCSLNHDFVPVVIAGCVIAVREHNVLAV